MVSTYEEFEIIGGGVQRYKNTLYCDDMQLGGYLASRLGTKFDIITITLESMGRFDKLLQKVHQPAAARISKQPTKNRKMKTATPLAVSIERNRLHRFCREVIITKLRSKLPFLEHIWNNNIFTLYHCVEIPDIYIIEQTPIAQWSDCSLYSSPESSFYILNESHEPATSVILQYTPFDDCLY
jgi:hypothetical protein